ncbi:MAG: META domain-containing protein [Coriobacteriia bacterium]
MSTGVIPKCTGFVTTISLHQGALTPWMGFREKYMAAEYVERYLGSLGGCSSAGAELEGTSRTLTGWSMSSLEPSSYGITALFADGQVGGHGGVNSYGATYETGSGGSLKSGDITSTLIAGPEDANRAEQGYFGLLAQGSFVQDDRRHADALWRGRERAADLLRYA